MWAGKGGEGRGGGKTGGREIEVGEIEGKRTGKKVLRDATFC